jgi:predicted nucleotidyltransferase
MNAMVATVASPPAALPPAVQELLASFVESAKACFAAELKSIVLFGSGADGTLRATSDLNLLVVLARFPKAEADAFREPLRLASVAGRAAVMFLLEAELPVAAEAFAVKFDDICRRRRVLFGPDPIASLVVSRDAKVLRLRQILMNLALRLRQQYMANSLREERLPAVLADVAGPLRAAAATLLELQGQSVSSPKAALVAVAAALAGGDCLQALTLVSQARETQALPAGVAGPAMFQLMALVEAMRSQAERVA